MLLLETTSYYKIFFKVFKSRRMRCLRQVTHVEMTSLDEVMVDKCEGKNLLRRPGHRWENNIKMDPKAVGWECVDLINLAEDRDWWPSWLF